jgi:tetratricopeptide (TPR) repeat protein
MSTEPIDRESVHVTESLMKKGLSLAALGNLQQAIQCFQAIVGHTPDSHQAHYNLALAHKQAGEYQAAVRHYEIAARLSPNDAESYYNWGNALAAAGDVQAAIQSYQKALQVRPESPDTLTNLAACFQEAGELESAIHHFRAALDLKPQSPDLMWNLALALLKAGDYASAWPLFEGRLSKASWAANYPHRYPQPRWEGKAFAGRHMLVHFEQGYGDTLQFMRFLPQVKALGGRVTFEVPGPLLPLAKIMAGVDDAIEFNHAQPANIDADLHIPLMSLAGIFATRSDTIPAESPYLQAPGERLVRWQQVSDPRALNIGLVWSGKDTDPLRACGPMDLEPLFALDGINWIGLQKGAAAEELNKIPRGVNVCSLGPELADFGDTAAVIHHLDLVVSVDTAVAHLAGAMGKPVFCLLRFAADWRWGTTGTHSPWYPSMRLFRQKGPGEWSAPVEAMATAISEMRHGQAAISRRNGEGVVEPATRAKGNLKGEGKSVQALFNEGGKHSAAGDLAAAIDAYRQVLTTDPTHIPALFNLGLCLRRSGVLDLAQEAYEAVLALDPNDTDACYNLANLHLSQKRYPEAIALYQRVLEGAPTHLDALLNLSVALWESDQNDAAQKYLHAALSNWPDSWAPHHHMGQLFSRQGHWTEALAYLSRAVELAPDAVHCRYNFGYALFQAGRYDEAVKVFRDVLNDAPDHLPAKLNLGNALQELGIVDEAEICFAEALQATPGKAEIRWNLSVIRLLKGRYPSAWPDFESRWDKANWRASYPFRHDLPRWQGQSLVGKTLFVHDEQGLGDVLQFVRYLALLKKLGGRILFETRAPLMRLCSVNRLADEVFARGEVPRLPEGCDFTIPLMSLPGVFGHSLDQIPSLVPYLQPSSERVRQWADIFPQGRRKVGLVWSGRPTRPTEAPGLRGRSCGLAILRPLIETHPEIFFVGLQQGPAAEEPLALGMKFKNLGPKLTDFHDTAGVIAHLDLVITVDTAVAHLAGAMGKAVWILLQHVGDWRWLLNRNDSPYYPSARLFRQSEPGDWPSVVSQITPRLADWASRR